MRLLLPLISILLAGAAVPRIAAGQSDETPPDSVSAAVCLVPDSAALDSAVKVAVASTRPKPVTPRLIVAEPPPLPEYRPLEATAWETVDLSDEPGSPQSAPRPAAGAGIAPDTAIAPRTVIVPGTSIQVALVRRDPATRVRQLLVRVPPNTVLPPHWHSVDETQLVVRGTVRMRDVTGRDETQGPGGFSFLPARTMHALSTGPAEEALLLVTSTGEWDVHLSSEPPGPQP